MDFDIGLIVLVCFLIFLAGFIDSIAGGGGLISLPAYIFAGLPPHMAFGTNKLSSTIGTVFSTARFIRSGKVHYKSALASAGAALIGSFIGAKATLAIDEIYLRYLLVVSIPIVAVFVLVNKGFGRTRAQKYSDAKIAVLSVLAGLVIGAYDGFFGPGTGTFLILAYTSFVGLDITTASGNAKIVNLASNIAALIAFIAGGKVLFSIGIPAAACGIVGNWLGSGLAIKNGARVIRPVFIVVLVLLFAKISYDFYWQY